MTVLNYSKYEKELKLYEIHAVLRVIGNKSLLRLLRFFDPIIAKKYVFVLTS
uniref:Uncharacterized protein n=1 Tax=Thermosporothrix sp. COM3 TaxID=2490863 RepID=A0A455SFS4_9CHLR|nr:hypothetical protein KTC_20580 [Thermosporothrix sp. COM3]